MKFANYPQFKWDCNELDSKLIQNSYHSVLIQIENSKSLQLCIHTTHQKWKYILKGNHIPTDDHDHIQEHLLLI